MKRLLLTTGLAIGFAVAAHAQVIFAGVSPASIEGNYDFTWADPAGGDWNSPDFNVPGTFVQDTLMIVDDGSTGTNPQGNPISAEGCNALINDLTGKIAVVYRNTCEFGTKALNAQNAGAVGVVIINREEGLVNMGGGNDGTNVDIPVVFIQASDGATLVNAMQNGPVVVFMGNRAGIYGDDLSIGAEDAMIPKAYAVPTQLAQNSGEIAFDLGMTMYNFGNSDANDAYVTATITNPAGDTLYNEEAGPFALSAIGSAGELDSVIIMPGETNSFPSFSLDNPVAGRFTVTYTARNGSVTDEFPDDNTVTTDLLIGQDFSYAEIDENDVTQTSAHYRPSGTYTSYAACIAFQDPNAERIGVDGLWFSAAATDSLTNQPFYIQAFQWNDVFTDLDDPNIAFDELEELQAKTYTFTENLEETMVYVEFDEDIQFMSDQRYLFCVRTFDPTLFIGFDTRTQYVANQSVYRQPIGVVEVSAEYDPIGFGADVVPSIRLGILDSSEVVVPVDTQDTGGGVGIAERASFQLNAYPNPTKDELLVLAEVDGNTDLTIVDMTGKVVMRDQVNFTRNNASVNVSGLRSGVYLLRLRSEDGRVSQTRIVKQ